MKLKLILSLLFLWGYHLYAQTSFISVVGGVNTSDYSGSSGESKAGYQLGVIATLPIYKRFCLTPELHFQSRNSTLHFDNIELDGNIYSMNFDINAKVLQLPVMATYRIQLNPPEKPNFLLLKIGPYISYGLGGKIESSDEFFNSSIRKNTFGDNTINPWDFGLKAEVTFAIQHISFGIGLDHGLINVSQIKNKKFETCNLWASLGYNFHLK